jgi:hypothetical protein
VEKVAAVERVDEPGMADVAATEGGAAMASGANVSLTESETAALEVPLDPAVPAALVVEVAMEVTVARPDISQSLSRGGITICLTSEPLAARVAVVAEEAPVWVELVASRERPAAEEPAATSPVATDVTEQVGRLVSQANPDGTERRETGDIGAIQARSR